MNLKFLNRRAVFSMRNLRIALVIIGLIIVLFNDTFGKLEGFIEFIFMYFITVCIAVFHWVFINIKFIINLKNEKTKTELMHLQSQVNPHFFFNMLNNLYGLVDKDSEKAKKLILKLSDMMRYSIYEGQKEYVSLQQEIDFISNYIELHKMRYHKDINVKFDINVANKDLKIMPLLFIILVENAFKHGIEVLRKNAFISIILTAKENRITLIIENNFDEEIQGENGIGLKNLERRLALAYPKKHEFTTSIHMNIYTSKLTLQL
ncbi:sensor histidine kinase [Tenacibaculum agarivorans]|uniref:sensor histidine kinase n=1 Tax=Tenacibaculum agarivorans TaxID=1908389 RepID=UPI00094B8909|nr:histidine kinase [Tenacibaculum agarivorans]